MGYRFELQHANMVAHLLDGNIDAFIDCFSGVQDFNPLKEFISSNRREKRFFSSREYEHEFEEILHDLERLVNRLKFKDGNKIYSKMEFNHQIFRLSRHIRRAKVKALLLSSHKKNFISEVRMLEEIVNIHPEDSCLILQTPPLENKQSVQLFNAFRGFEEALKHYDEFPGVLLWDEDESIFISVDNERDTIGIFEHLLLNTHKPIQALKKYYSYKSKKKYIYLLHLSDLHLGGVTHGRKNELLRLIDSHSIHKDDVPIIPIITGDLMDSPNQNNKDKVEDFTRELNMKFNHESIAVLGNHDVDSSGISSFFRANKQATISLLNHSRIEKFDKYLLIIIKFCSNQNGNLAQGEIGEEQLTKVATELDAIKNIKYYTLIAILHHHPIEITTPDWYKGKWFERVLGRLHNNTMKLNDANRFIDWCKERKVKAILHGHKHIPNISEVDGISCIGAGSSTGNIKHTDNGKTYISFNVIKYDLTRYEPTQATIYFEETIGTGVKHISVETL